jgi:DNA polymerase delta subunit 1
MRYDKTSTCQLEVDIAYDKLISHAPEGSWSKVSPLRVLSFDIECAGRKGIFPEPDVDPVIQIANLITVQGEKKPRVKNVFTLQSCANIVGADVFSFEDEAELLKAWQQFVIESDPDIITGYNIMNFDFPYLLNRAGHLKIDSFHYLGRIKSKIS